MRNKSPVTAVFHAASVCMLCLAAAYASAIEPAPTPEPALSLTADDPQLQWGPCPGFMPEGCALAVVHGDPARDNLDAFLRLPGNTSIPWHWHTSAERMVLLAGELHVTYEGQPMSVLKPGTYAYGPAKREHQAVCASADPCVLFIAFESPLDAVPRETAGE